MNDEHKYDAVDQALAARLNKLGSAPVDTSRLDRVLRSRLQPAPKGWHNRLFPILTVAASVVFVAAVALALLQGREAQASPDVIAQMHRELVAGTAPSMHVASIEEANKQLGGLMPNCPLLPEAPSAHTMTCCMRQIGNKQVACVLLDQGGTPVTMCVAAASEVESPKSPTTVRNGTTYHVQSVGELHMVMTERENRWICLIGEMPEEKLMDIANGVHF